MLEHSAEARKRDCAGMAESDVPTGSGVLCADCQHEHEAEAEEDEKDEGEAYSLSQLREDARAAWKRAGNLGDDMRKNAIDRLGRFT